MFAWLLNHSRESVMMSINVIDRVVEWLPGEKAEAYQHITMSHIIFDTHFPLKPVWPGMLSIMAMQRLAEGVLASQDDYATAYCMTELSNVKWRSYVKPGDRMMVKVELTGKEPELMQFKGKIQVAGKTVVTVGRMSFSAAKATAEIQQQMSAYWQQRGVKQVVVV